MEHQPNLTTAEISNLWTSYQNDTMAICGIKYFLANVEDTNIQSVLEYALAISQQHVQRVTAIFEAEHHPIFNDLLHKNDLSGVSPLTPEVTDLTAAPFPDKLMMYHVSALVASGTGHYGISMSTSPRRDLGIDYARLMAEMAKYANDGAKMMIQNGWMEKPPEAVDRQKLAKKK